MNSRKKNLSSGIGVLDYLLALFIIAGVSLGLMYNVSQAAKRSKIAQLKAGLVLVHQNAVGVALKFKSSQLQGFIGARPSLKACFEGAGVNCECYSSGTCAGESFPLILNWQDPASALTPFARDSNHKLNSRYDFSLKECTDLQCGVNQSTTIQFLCSETSCKSGLILVQTLLNQPAVTQEDRALFASVSNLRSEVTVAKAENVEFFKNIASTCSPALGYNAGTNSLVCDTSDFSSNVMFDIDLGITVKNSSLTFHAEPSQSSSNLSEECAANEVTVIENDRLVCKLPSLNVCAGENMEIVMVNGLSKCLSKCANGLSREADGSCSCSSGQVKQPDGTCVAQYIHYSGTCNCGFYGMGDPVAARGKLTTSGCTSCKQGKPGSPYYFESTLDFSCPSGYVVQSLQNHTYGTGENSYATQLSTTSGRCVGYSTTEQGRFSRLSNGCSLTCVKQ